MSLNFYFPIVFKQAHGKILFLTDKANLPTFMLSQPETKTFWAAVDKEFQNQMGFQGSARGRARKNGFFQDHFKQLIDLEIIADIEWECKDFARDKVFFEIFTGDDLFESTLNHYYGKIKARSQLAIPQLNWATLAEITESKTLSLSLDKQVESYILTKINDLVLGIVPKLYCQECRRFVSDFKKIYVYIKANYEPSEEINYIRVVGRAKYRLLLMFSLFLDEKIKDFEMFGNKYYLLDKIEELVEHMTNNVNQLPELNNTLLDILNSGDTSPVQNQMGLMDDFNI